MPDLLCPRCGSADVDEEARICRSCRICYDDLRAFEPHMRQHTMVTKRWGKWRQQDRVAHERKRVQEFLGG